jgi:t-SNARE complex subunit (syntaxin)
VDQRREVVLSKEVVHDHEDFDQCVCSLRSKRRNRLLYISTVILTIVWMVVIALTIYG